MGFQKVEYGFPDEGAPKNDIEIESSSMEAMEQPVKAEPEVDIEVIDDTPKADRGRKPSAPPEEVTEDELESYSGKVRSRIKHLSKGYHDERRAKEQALREREELERLAAKLVEENKTLQGTVGKNQTMMVEQAKKTAAGELAAAKRAYQTAYDRGDSKAVVEAQEALINAKNRVDKLESYKPKKEAEPEMKTAPQEAPKTETIQRDEKAVRWAEENSWFGSDDEMTSFALGYHNKLVKEGVDPKSDEYYEKVNTRMREIFPDEFEDTLEEERPKKRSVVAPASRSTAPKKVKLTQTQVAIANRLGVPLELYAKQVAEEQMRKQ